MGDNKVKTSWQKKLTIISGVIISLTIIFTTVTKVYGWTLQIRETTQQIQQNKQHIEQNKKDIEFANCMRDKKAKQADLRYNEKRLSMFNYDYISKGLLVPPTNKDEFLGLPNKISTLTSEITNLKCGGK